MWLWTIAAHAQVPTRQIPPSVMMELQLLENRFEIALAMDCAPERCFSKGCAYIDHQVADQPRRTSLPGLGGDPGPGSGPSQEYLTRARCSFAHEDIEGTDVQALTRRLRSKLSKAWTVVDISQQALPKIPAYLHEEPKEEEVEEEEKEAEPEPEVLPPPPPPPWSPTRELWDALLPHFWWMIGFGLLTFATSVLIWAFRRVGQPSFEEQALLASLAHPEEPPAPEEPAEPEIDPLLGWDERIDGMDPAAPDPEMQALVRELLRGGDMPLLAKAVLRFPKIRTAFPSGPEIASAKLDLAEYLKGVDDAALPSDETFAKVLNRHAMSAALSSQADADVARSLREDFGASGLVELIVKLPSRFGALLFSLAPTIEQLEMTQLLSQNQAAHLTEQLLRSNRMDAGETDYLFAVLNAARANEALPPAPPASQVSDRGRTHDATGALSALLPKLAPEHRATLFNNAKDRFQGTLPGWMNGIFFADMLDALPQETQVDMLLGIEVDRLAAWFSLLDRSTQEDLRSAWPNALRASVQASSVFSSKAQQLALAQLARRDLAEVFQRALQRSGIDFVDVIA